MQMPGLVKQIIFYALRIAFGLVFLFGAYAKLPSIEPFEWTIAETGLFSFSAANLVARLFIILEAIIGLLFIFNLPLSYVNKKGKRKSVTYIIAAWLLIIFNVYLMYIMTSYGNNGNCGCFGKMLEFTPMQAYLKNILLLAVLYIISCFYFPHPLSNQWYMYSLVVTVCASYVFIKFPPDFIYIKDKQDVSKPYKLNLDKLYSTDGTPGLPFDSTNSKFVLALVSTHCKFCVKAVRRLRSMKAKHAELPIFVASYSDSASYKAFLNETQGYNLPFKLVDDVEYLNSLSNPDDGLPALFWIENGAVIRKSNYYNLDEQQFLNWIKK
jgi:Methylamine utilisation protein MauE